MKHTIGESIECPHCNHVYDTDETDLIRTAIDDSPFLEYCNECEMPFEVSIRVTYVYHSIALTDNIRLEA